MNDDNVFLTDCKKFTLSDYMNFHEEGRDNLGDQIPVLVYRLLEYSLREQLEECLGKEKQIEIFRKAGYQAGEYFAANYLDLGSPFPQFIAQLAQKMEEMKIGILRVEKVEEETGKLVLTVSEDADCSGMPLLGDTVCNYDEGFIAGVLSSYTKKNYYATEVDCWATGDRVCRFEAEIQKNGE